MKQLHQLLKLPCVLALITFLLLFTIIIPIRLAIASHQAPHPQAILTLGGEPAREKFTAQFAQKHPSLHIWVSTGIPPKQARHIFQSAGIPDDHLHLDYRAVDTVTNFTTLVPDFQQRHIEHIYLITSDYHMPRAKAIATLVLGSRGIIFTPVSVPSNQPKESKLRILRDIVRSLLWIITGRTGANFNPRRIR